MKTLLIGTVIVTAGWMFGKAIHSFVDYIVEFNKKRCNDAEEDR